MNLYHYHSNPEQLFGYDQRFTTVPSLAYKHAKSTDKRFPEGEDAIASHPDYAYWYAEDIIEGRWPKGEKAIASDPYYAYWYARYVIGGRFPEGEATIKKSVYWGEYKRRFLE